ncbi:unnamed protein product [Rhodiola kirilowii]
MTSDRELVLYVCVAEGTTIVADFVRNDDSDLETLAARCLQLTPANHALYSHTVDGRSYVFLIGDRFVVFGIFDEGLEKGKRLGFLVKVRDGFDEILGRKEAVLVDNLGYRSFQGEMGEVLQRLLDGLFETIGLVNGLVRIAALVSNERAKNVAPLQLGNGLMKKKKRGASSELNGESRGTNHLDDDDDELSRETLGFVNKHGNGSTGGGRQRAARSSWRKRAWIVLLIDVVICLVLFGVWLYICRGFKCLNA